MKIISERQRTLPRLIHEDEAVGRTVGASAWMAAGNFTATGIKFLGTLILARLLMPEDFGVISAAYLLSYFVMVFANFGITLSVIHAKRPTSEDLSTNWWSNVLIDGFAALVCVLGAPLASRFFGNETIQWFIYAIAIQVVLESLGSVHVALLKREFRFRAIAWIAIVPAVVQMAVAVVLIFFWSWGVAGIAVGLIVGEAVALVVKWVVYPWMPSASFSLERFREQFRFGRWFLGANIVSYVNQTLDQLIVGKMLSVSQLGFYTLATSIPTTIVSRLLFPINTVTFVTVSAAREQSPVARAVFFRVVRDVSVLSVPVLAGLAVVSRDLVGVVYGPRWLEIHGVMAVVCVAAVFRMWATVMTPIINALGQPRITFMANLVSLPIGGVAVGIGAMLGGLMGVAWASVFTAFVMMCLLGFPTLRALGMSIGDMGRAVWPACGGSLVMVSTIVGLLNLTQLGSIESVIIRLGVCVVVGGIAYVAGIWAVSADLCAEYWKVLRSWWLGIWGTVSPTTI